MEPSIASTAARSPKKGFGPGVDPYMVDAQLTEHYLGEFFAHFNVQLYHIFSQSHMQTWIRNGQPRSEDDILLLYTMTLYGTIYSQTKARANHRDMLLQIVHTSINHPRTKSSLQFVQVLLILAIYTLARGHVNDARETCNDALRAARDLGIHQDRSCHVVGNDEMLRSACHDLDFDTFAECCRRTFWAISMTDTLLLFCGGSVAAFSDVDCELRPPCPDQAYEAKTIPRVSTVHVTGGTAPQLTSWREVGLMGIMLEGFGILREIVVWTYHLQHMSSSQVQASSQGFGDSVERRLSRWRATVSEWARASGQSSATPRSEERPCQLHVVYHLSQMILHRYIRHGCLSPEQVSVSCREARRAGYDLLHLVSRLHERPSSEEDAVMIACPITGYAVFMAIDIISSAGSISSLLDHTSEESFSGHGQISGNDRWSSRGFMDLVTAGIETLQSLSPYWETGSRQSKLVQERLSMLLVGTKMSQKPGYFVREPLFRQFGAEMDVIYGLDKVALFQSLGMGDRVRSEVDMYEVVSIRTPS
jgi:hypothetical protein